jgi:hypothetical protein
VRKKNTLFMGLVLVPACSLLRSNISTVGEKSSNIKDIDFYFKQYSLIFIVEILAVPADGAQLLPITAHRLTREEISTVSVLK